MLQTFTSPEIQKGGIRRAILVLLAVAFAALILAAAAVAWLQARYEENSSRLEQALEAQARIGDLAMLKERIETARRGYLVAGHQSFREIFEASAAMVPPVADSVARLTAEHPEQQRLLEALRELTARQRQFQNLTISLVEAGETDSAMAAFETDPGVLLARQARLLLDEMREQQEWTIAQVGREQQRILGLFYSVLSAAGLLLVLVTGMTITAIYRYTRDLGTSRDQLRELNEHLEDAVKERTAELQRANDEIQRFAYIVSHDLRSPLVNVMGFTSELDAARKPIAELLQAVTFRHPELVTPEMELAVKEDLPEAVDFIRTSTQKMDRLISEILRLSREGRRTLAPEQLDMDRLVRGIVDSLHHQAADRGASIKVEHPLPDVISDRVAVEQVLSNLIENAIKYLKPGQPGLVQVRGLREDGLAIYEVQDNGRGIDAKDHERIFELFRRSGTQDQPGEGIGLAHVRALAYRLGGFVRVHSELDRGTTFRLSLPLSLNQ